jgi:hypothetical protein
MFRSFLLQRDAFFGLCCLLLACVASGQSARVVGRSIYHSDHSRTEVVTNPEVHEMTESTYGADNVLSVRKVFLLNERGEPTQGNVYDGRGQLVARVQCLYDDLGRRGEDRLVNLDGEVFQRVIYGYNDKGKALPPKVINLQVANAPTIRPPSIDFTKDQAMGSEAATPTSSKYAPQPIRRTGATSASPSGESQGNSQSTTPKKGGFFQRLLKR